MKAQIFFDSMKNFDIYGVPVGVNFNNQQIHKTSFGAIISLFVFIAFGLQFYQTGQELFDRNNPQIITSEQYVRNPQRMDFDKKQQTLMMGFSTTSSKYISDPSIIQVNATLSTIKNVFNETSQSYSKQTTQIPLRIRACKIEDIQVGKLKSFFNLLPLNQMFCFDDNQEVFIEGDYSGDIYTRVDVVFNQCVNSTLNNSVVCQPQKKIDLALSNVSFLVYMIDKILDPSNFENPFDYQGINIQSQASNQHPIQYTAYFENYYIESDVGLIQKDVQKERDFIFTGTDNTIMYNNPNLVMKFTMRPYKNKQILMQRKYMKFTDLFAQLGGLLKFLTMIGFILAHPFAKLHLNKEIINSVFDFEFFSKDCQKSGIIQHLKQKNEQKIMDTQEKNLSPQNIQTTQYQQNQNTEQMNLKLKQILKSKSPIEKRQSNFSRNFENFSQKANSDSEESHNFSLGISKLMQSQYSPMRKNSVFRQIKVDRPIQRQLSKSIQLSEGNNKVKEQQITENVQILGQIISNIQRLLNPIKEFIKLSPFQYISYFFFSHSKKSQEDKALIKEGIKKVQSRLDIQHILHKLQEIEKLKQIVLDQDQIKLFEILPRPVLSNSQQLTEQKQSNQYYETKKKTYEEKVEEACSSLINILNKPKKSQRDIQLIQLLDSNIYKIIQQSEQAQERNPPFMTEDFSSKYNQNDEILENNNQQQINTLRLKESNTLLKFQNQNQDLEMFSQKTEISDEIGVKTDYYFNFYKKCNKNSLNIS
ncbi:zinc knuckle protein, putative (macronuclear) [Tetrahymena thermophila SB210]|uniref:Zinc knuckle protein, putative n=1 Tax=Tetrahymena thermophila (strain SB210) TaxID=312017 RepID=Q22BI0_TETTS|nr:zinc knuckle protein, putative [Tetrahymena thermophila SB210]EAR82624.1 zinc knuckle protein, putative [Tetrahymena thermophila SB210]|eukprot:XP_001030287.1 zinc knuckle protein, putative [Tetrahymena thermophila SB210]